MRLKNRLGQASIEYILVLSLLIVIVATMVKGINSALKSSAGSLSYVISHHLSIGVCQKDCFTKGYANY